MKLINKIEPISFASPFYGQAEINAVTDVIKSKWIVGGKNLVEFENKFSKLCNMPHAIGVSSWTTGAFLVLKAWGIGQNDEVLVPSLTFIASVNVIVHTGATPVFVDIHKDTWNIDPKDLEMKITKKTKAIIAIDQIGLPCDMDEINKIAKKYNLKVLEDAACAFGSVNAGRPVGSLCEVSVFSLHARKIITTGEGGMIVTSNENFSKKLKQLRHQGMSITDFERQNLSPTVFESYPEIGYNFRLTDLQAALGLAQLKSMDYILQKRKKIAENFNCYFLKHKWFQCPKILKNCVPNWQSYQLKLNSIAPFSRNELMEILFEYGIPCKRGVMASHLELPYQILNAHLPITEEVAQSTIQIPIHPSLTDKQQTWIIDVFEKITNQYS